MTVRKAPTTQIAISVAEWPGNTFLLWLPENVSDIWTQWTVDDPTQRFERTEKAGLRWVYDGNPHALLTSEIVPLQKDLYCEVRVTSRSREALKEVFAQNCLHFPKAPDFQCLDFTRVFLRHEGEWRSVASLAPTMGLPMYYRPGFLASGRRDTWGGYFAFCNQKPEADHPLMVCVSKDGARCIGTASENYQCVFHNQGHHFGCIHSHPEAVPSVAPGETVVFRQKFYFVEGGLRDCVARFEEDFRDGRFRVAG
jgi:hypothetical protein